MSSIATEHVDFAGLRIAFDARVLRPRAWTEAQSRWAGELLDHLPSGPVLELCSGAGQIGLAAVAHTDRKLVCVDVDPVAASYAERNARDAGLGDRVQVRSGGFEHVVHAGERFPLIIVDPPWVVSDDTGRYPDDPLFAIDGGPDGLAVARSCLRAIEAHLAEAGAALLQLGTEEQVRALVPHDSGVVRCADVRRFERGVVALLVHA